MIRSFKDRESEKLFLVQRSRKVPSYLHQRAVNKLWLLDAATAINDLRIPPSNHLEQLVGDRKGQHSIRINRKWHLFQLDRKQCLQCRNNRLPHMKKLHPPHPGEILTEEFLKPLNLTQYRLAKDISVPARRINEIIHGTRSISADTALRLARFFGNSAEFWLNLQAHYDLEVGRNKLKKRLQMEVKVFQLSKKHVNVPQA